MFIDIHCHCLAGLDDGPSNMSEAVSLCRMLEEDGILRVCFVSHESGMFGAERALIDETRCARKALAASLANSLDHRSVVIIRSRGTQWAYMSTISCNAS